MSKVEADDIAVKKIIKRHILTLSNVFNLKVDNMENGLIEDYEYLITKIEAR